MNPEQYIKENRPKARPTNFRPIGDDYGTADERGINFATCKSYKVFRDGNYTVYPIMENGRHVGNKIRTPNKEFLFEGKIKGGLFGQHLFPAGSAKYITLTEGEYDALSAYELLGSQYPVVSVWNGAAGAEKNVKENFEYLNSFPEIVINFDNDEPGQEAAQKVAAMFAPDKVRILKLAKAKDANEYLKRKAHKIYSKEWWAAPKFVMDGLKLGSSMWEEIWEKKDHFQVLYPFDGLNLKTYGIRLSELVVINAPTGVGKTSLMKEIEHSLLVNNDVKEKRYGVGFMHFEEPNADTALGILSVHNSRPYHLPDTERPEKEIRRAYEEVWDTDRVVIWDHFGSNNINAVLDKVRHMHALGCKYIVLDHLSIVVSDQSGDERKQLDEITTKLKTLCMNLNIALIVVVHQNRQGDIRGTAAIEQLANIVIRLDREIEDVNEWRQNVTKVTVTKNRFCGRCGPATYLYYNENTGRLIPLNKEQIDIYEAGGHMEDDQIPF